MIQTNFRIIIASGNGRRKMRLGRVILETSTVLLMFYFLKQIGRRNGKLLEFVKSCHWVHRLILCVILYGFLSVKNRES